MSDATCELVVTLFGIFPLFDEFGGRSFLVDYVWQACIDFLLSLIKQSLNIRRRTHSHLTPKIIKLIEEFHMTLMGRTFLNTSLHHLSMKISGFGQGGRDASQSCMNRFDVRSGSVKYAFLAWRHAHALWSLEQTPWRSHTLCIEN